MRKKAAVVKRKHCLKKMQQHRGCEGMARCLLRVNLSSPSSQSHLCTLLLWDITRGNCLGFMGSIWNIFPYRNPLMPLGIWISSCQQFLTVKKKVTLWICQHPTLLRHPIYESISKKCASFCLKAKWTTFQELFRKKEMLEARIRSLNSHFLIYMNVPFMWLQQSRSV